MDRDKRIHELEKKVSQLTDELHDLLADDEETPAVPETKAKQVLRQDVSRNVGKVLGGEAGETLESRIGGIWLSRIAVVLLMTAFAIGARMTLYTDVIAPWHKVVAGYGLALAGIAYGVLRRRSASQFPKTILGAGLAGVYCTTYASFFTEGMCVFDNRALAIPILLACLLFLFFASHMSRSLTVAGISMFLVYYTVAASCMANEDAIMTASENLTYALATCAMLAAFTLVFHVMHRWVLFTWAALVATHLTYLFYFLGKPAGLGMTDREYFWISNGFLTVCYVLFSCACIIDARRTGEYRRMVAPMSGVNSFVFFCLSWVAIRQNYVEQEWVFRMSFAGGLLFFTVLAELTGPRHNYLAQIFAAKVVIMFTLAMQAYLSGEKLMVAMALECLALAFSYKRSGVVFFKVLGLLLMCVTFVGCIFNIKALGEMHIGAFTIPSNWFCGAGTAIVFAVVAWFYEQFIWRTPPKDRIVTGQWFLADTFLDVRGATASMLYAAAGALILLTITIFDLGDTPRLPYILAAESVIMAAGGYLLRTPQVEVASVLLLGAAHLCYYVSLAMGTPGFLGQENYALYTLLLAMFTFFGGHLWERYLYRVEGGKPWEHHVVAAIPYLAATFMLASLIAQELAPLHIPVAQNALGAGLLLIGSLTAYPGVKASGMLALGLGTATFYMGLYNYERPYAGAPHFVPLLVLFLCAYFAAERLFVILQKQENTPSRAEDVFRTILVAVAATLGLLALKEHCEPEYLTFYWLAQAVAGFALGAVFRESRYRWAAMLLLLCTVVRAFQFDLKRLPPVYQFLSFAALAAALLVISWGYSGFRQRALRRIAKEPPPDG